MLIKDTESSVYPAARWRHLIASPNVSVTYLANSHAVSVQGYSGMTRAVQSRLHPNHPAT